MESPIGPEEGRVGEILADSKDGLSEETQLDVIGQEGEGINICQHFLLGKCHFGDRCRLAHSAPIAEVPETLKTEEGKSRKSRKKISQTEKREKQAREMESKEPGKKPRMRTADDVISRVLWDSSVDPASFVVGHLDRFLGVLERPFSEFSWDTPVCDCDFSEELALPRHRILYFSYKGQRVWDRESRTDRVFGSTGQTLAPPFDGENQQQENETPDTAEQESSNNLEEPMDKPHEASGEHHEENTDVSTGPAYAENEQRNAGEHSLTETAEEGSTNTGNTSRGKQEAVRETAPRKKEVVEDTALASLTEGLSLSQRDGEMKEDKEEWEDSRDGKEERENLAWGCYSPSSPGRQKWDTQGTMQVLHGPQEQRQGWRKRNPTHFLTFRVDSPAAILAFQRVQRRVVSVLPQSKPHWSYPNSLHVTMTLLVLPGPAEVSAAAEILRTTIRECFKPPFSVTFTPKLKHFNGKVLHLSPQPLADIQTLNALLQEVYKEKGWLHHHSKSPTYHLTLAKVDRTESERVFEGVGAIKLGKDINFGKLEVNKLYLCVNGTLTEDGFYETVCVVKLPNV